MSIISTSISIAFRTSLVGDGVLAIEADDRPEGMNAGKTQFTVGDNPGLLVYKTSNVNLLSMHTTEGGLNDEGADTRVVEEFITYADSREGEFSKPVYSDFTILQVWGGSVGDYFRNDTQLILPEVSLLVVKVRYTVRFHKFRLSGASGEAPVVVLARGEEV